MEYNLPSELIKQLDFGQNAKSADAEATHELRKKKTKASA